MIFKINAVKNKLIAENYKKIVEDLKNFYEIDWNIDIPRIYIMKDRKTINSLKKKKSECYQVGFCMKNDIYILDKKSFRKESCHKIPSKERYLSLIRHEISHVFYALLSNNRHNPRWMWEGVALYTDGTLHKSFERPKIFKNFLEFYDKEGKGIYRESGFVIDLLVKKFKKNKLIKMIRRTSEINSEKEFLELFRDIYGFELSYYAINNIYKNHF